MNRKSLGVRGKLVFCSSVAIAALAASAALAATVDLDTTSIHGGGHTTWYTGASEPEFCVPFAPSGTTFARDGTTADRGSGVNGALMLAEGGDPFVDSDGMGEKHGQTVSAGPDHLGTMLVSAKGTAIQDEPALRVLYALKNPTGGKLSVTPQMVSNLASEDSTRIEKTSNGDADLQTGDRWIVTSAMADPLFPITGPPVTNVLYGKGAAVGVDSIDAEPGQDCSAGGFPDVVMVSFKVKIPAHSTRYLMFFAELNNDSNAKAVKEAKKYNDHHLSSSLLKGISNGVKSKILNWDL